MGTYSSIFWFTVTYVGEHFEIAGEKSPQFPMIFVNFVKKKNKFKCCTFAKFSMIANRGFGCGVKADIYTWLIPHPHPKDTHVKILFIAKHKLCNQFWSWRPSRAYSSSKSSETEGRGGVILDTGSHPTAKYH